MTTVYSKMAPTAISIAGIYSEVIKIKIMVLISFDAVPSLNIKKVPRGKILSGNFETNNNDLKGEKMTRTTKTQKKKAAAAREATTTQKLMTTMTTTKKPTTMTKKSLTSSTTMLSERLKVTSKNNQT